MTWRLILGILALLAVALVAPLLFPPSDGQRAAPPPGSMPWEIETQPDGGSRVFGLTLGAATIEDARRRFGPDMQIAIVAAPGEHGSLEAYFETVSLGFLTGKVIVTGAVPAETLDRWVSRAAKADYMESTTRKITLGAEDLPAAQAVPIRAIAFIPAAALDEQTVIQRFGQPAERIRGGETVEHFLYPAKGLDLRLDTKGKEVLQYVAPRDFAAVREPLFKAQPAR
jgi:hypothetical protein